VGRGLSDLQRWILRRAGSVRNVPHADIMAGFFKMQPKRALQYDKDGILRWPGGKYFDPQQIGAARYRAIQATISRACTRLEVRGLVVRLVGYYSHWSGVAITDKGREWISANSCADLPTT
jgi:hypothetical protein